jgi:YggT family protein
MDNGVSDLCNDMAFSYNASIHDKEYKMIAFVKLITTIVNLYTYILIFRVVVDWLMYLEVINTYNRHVTQLRDILRRLTDPLLIPIQKAIYRLTRSIGIDLSPLILILLLQFFVNLLWELLV